MKEAGFSSIAVDMGAGSIRVMLGTLDESGLSLEEIHRIENEIRLVDGRDTWDMERIAREIRTAISKIYNSERIPPSSIGVDSWGVDYVLLGSNGELVETPVAYRDKRTTGMREQWSKLMPELETFSRTGINFYIFNTLFQLLSAKGSGSLRRTSRILFIPGYISYLLSGKAVNELTIASTSQMLGVEGDQWDAEILSKVGLSLPQLGRVATPGTKLGPVNWLETGGKHLECVAVCGHDTACVVAAIPVENPGFAFISAGTWCIVGIESSRPLISEEALKLGITNERGYGNTYRSLKNIVGLWLLQGLKKHLSAEVSYAQMDEMLEEGDDAVQFIDPDDPLFYNPEHMKEAFDAFFGKTGQPPVERFSDYIRCAYDSLCFSFRYHIEQLEKLSDKPIGVIHLVGGGSQSDYLCQRISTICEREVISGPVEGATMGNLIIQGIAMGKIANLQKGRDLVKKSCQVKKYLPGEVSGPLMERYRKYLTLKIHN